VVVGLLAGVVLGNGVHRADGMTAMAIEHAASSRMPAGMPGACTAGAQRPVPDVVTCAPEITVMALVNFMVCIAGMIDGLLLG
jgi:hypothetical protein